MSNESYIERCLNALPPERRDALRRVLREIEANGDPVSSKLLILNEANNAYLQSLLSSSQKDTTTESAKIHNTIQEFSAKLVRLSHNLMALRNFRVKGLLLLMAVAAFVGAALLGFVYWSSYTEGRSNTEFLKHLNRNGLDVSTHIQNGKLVLRVEGRISGATYLKNDRGEITGIDLVR